MDAPIGQLRGVRAADRDDLASYVFDLTTHEQHRLGSLLAATPDLDPGAVLATETEAHRMLYSDLDAEQQAVYQLLVDAGMFDA